MDKLTVQAARALEPGAKLRDHDVRGLQLVGVRRRPGSNVNASWLLYYRINGLERRPKLGDFPSLTIEQARAAARAILARVAVGEDFQAQREADREAPTVADLCTAWKDTTHAKAKKTAGEDDRRISNHILPLLGRIKVAELTTKHIDDALTRVHDGNGAILPAKGTGRKAKGRRSRKPPFPYEANRTRALLRTMLEYAEHNNVRWRPKGSNPADDAYEWPEVKRARKLEAPEWPLLRAELATLAERKPRHADALRVALYSGARIGEVLKIEPRHRVGNSLVLHEHKSMRTGEPRVIRMPRQGWEILERYPVRDSLEKPATGRYFAGVAYSDLSDEWRALRERAGLPGLRIHDLRRSFGSVLVSHAGGTRDNAQELLGHQSVTTTEIYTLFYNPVSDAFAQATADKIDAALA